MHEPIKDSLEEYLKGSQEHVPQAFHAHLEACPGCASELQRIQTQSDLLRSLQCSEVAEPRAGFYGRVMDRIDGQRNSIWSVFLEPRFGRGLAIASAALMLLLGTYWVTTEPETVQAPAAVVTINTPPAAAVVQQQEAAPADTAEQQEQRDAILVDLATYHE